MLRVVGAVIALSTVAWADPVRGPTSRVTVDANVGIGVIPDFGGSVAYERRITASNGLLVRGGYAFGELIGGETAGDDIFYVHVGHRYYWGGFYVGSELGAVLFRHRGSIENSIDHMLHPSYEPSISGAFGIGGRISIVDVGVSVFRPAIGFQVHVGIDVLSF